MKAGIIKKTGILLITVFLIIQFFHPARNQGAEMLASDITKVTQVPDSVLKIFQIACYDCHSNNTRYPWYNNIQPVAWWMNHHINEGKEHLNFSTFGEYDTKKANKKMRGIAKEIKEDEMPLSSYTLIHRNAVLNAQQKEMIINWTKTTVFTVQN